MANSLENIDVVILTGGKGERLISVVNDRPKTMVEINRSPLLVTLTDYLSSQGFKRFILCTGYRGDYIKEYFEKHPSESEIIISHEKQPLGTGGGVKHAEKFIQSDPFIVLNGDSICELDYAGMNKYHEEKASDATIVVTKVRSKSDFGSIVIDHDFRVLSFIEKKESANTNYVNAGIYCFRREMLQLMPSFISFSIEKEYFPSIINRSVFAYVTSQPFFDIGTPERLQLFTQKNK